MNNTSPVTRRSFLATSGKALAGAALVAGVARPGYTAENNTIKIALIGCGGRGTGAANEAMSTQGPTKLWAVADVFESHVKGALNNLKGHGAKADVPAERQFTGFDGYRKAIDSLDKGDLVILATPPAFRPLHMEYAVAQERNIFMEKSFAVDAPGIRRVLKAGEEGAKKNLKIAGGLMSRHYRPLEEAIAQIHKGLIGDVITAWAYRMHGPVGYSAKQPGMKEMAFQISNYSCFTWLNGSFIVDWLIHNIDVCCWAKNGWPVSVQGMGGRQTRLEPDQLFDHYGAEYTFADGTRMMAQGRHIANTYEFFGDIIHGTTGSAVLGEGIPDPVIYKGHNRASDKVIWRYQGPKCNAYQYEHDLLFDAIRNNKQHNETERCAKSCMAAIMGRMACESGKQITWDEALKSDLVLAPGIEKFTMDTEPPAKLGSDGEYTVAMPGETKGF